VTLRTWLSSVPTAADPGVEPAGPRATAEIPAALREVPAIRRPARATDETANEMASVDVLLDLTAAGVGEPGWAAETWRFGYGPTHDRRAAGSALLSYVRGSRGTAVALVREGDGALLREGVLQTSSWWRGELLDHLLTDVIDWPADAIRDRLATDATMSPAKPTPAQPTPATAPRSRSTAILDVPGGRAVLSLGAVGRRVAGLAASMREPDWRIGVVPAPIEAVLRGPLPEPTWLPAPAGHFHADPFGLVRDGTLHVVFEDYDHAAGIGTIAHVSVAPDGSVSEPRTILTPGVHASYPFLVEDAGGIFLLPETSAAGELVLYEADPFPTTWRPAVTLLERTPAVDATLVRHADTWWLFATRADLGDNQSLSIWHAPRIRGPWTAHARNPVKVDVRSSRPGGTPFVVDGALYRPAQDGSRRYGGRIVVNRVEVLTPTEFREVPVATVEPWPGSSQADGLHTLSAAGDRVLVDGNAMHLVPAALPRTLAARAGRLRADLRRRR
jgi:hypothetical protein